MSQQSSQRSESTIAAPADSDARDQSEAHARAQFAARRAFKRARRRAYNPYYLSLPSLLLTAGLAVVVALVLIAAFVATRGEARSSHAGPVIEIISAPDDVASPLTSAEEPDQPGASETQSVQVILPPETPAKLYLAGPAVPTVIITNTPVPLAIGQRAAVHNVGNDELNIRNIPSLRESQILFRAPAGTVFEIIGGPQEADGFTWWQLNDQQFQVQGWAVAIYLQSVDQDTGT